LFVAKIRGYSEKKEFSRLFFRKAGHFVFFCIFDEMQSPKTVFFIFALLLAGKKDAKNCFQY